MASYLKLYAEFAGSGKLPPQGYIHDVIKKLMLVKPGPGIPKIPGANRARGGWNRTHGLTA
jgi:hypothetical protein